MATTEDYRGICVECGYPATRDDRLVVVDGRHVHTGCAGDQDN